MNADHGPVFARRPHPAPVAANARASMLEDPGFGRVFTDHMATIRWTEERGWRDAELRPRASRSSSIRRAPCCTTPRRSSRASRPIVSRTAASPCSVPRSQRPPLPGFGRAAGDARACPKAVPAGDRGAGEDRRRLDPGRRRQPLPAPVHVRQRDLPRRAAGVGISVRGHRLARRLLFQGRQEDGERLALRTTIPAPRPAAPAPPNAAAITPRASSPRPRRSDTAATRSCSSTPPSTAGSRSSAA